MIFMSPTVIEISSSLSVPKGPPSGSHSIYTKKKYKQLFSDFCSPLAATCNKFATFGADYAHSEVFAFFPLIYIIRWPQQNFSHSFDLRLSLQVCVYRQKKLLILLS